MSTVESQVFPYHDKDLSALPSPDVLEALDYEALLAERKAMYNGLAPLLLDSAGQPTVQPATLVKTERETFWKIPVSEDAGLFYLDLESDPTTRHLQQDAYVEMWYRNRVNQAALSVMPAFARGADLEHNWLAYLVDGRKEITAAAGTTPAVMESDDSLLRRMLLGIEGLAVGGTQGWYLSNALNASGLVKDAYVTSPSECEIEITILSHEGSGVASQSLLDEVYAYMLARPTRVMGDRITIKSATVIEYSVEADLWFYPGPTASTLLIDIQQEWANFRARSERLGLQNWITKNGVYGALDVPANVYRVDAKAFYVGSSDQQLPIELTPGQAAYCTGLKLYDMTNGEVNRKLLAAIDETGAQV